MNVYRKLQFFLSKKEKRQVVGLIILIFISALLETLGVSIIIPLITAVVDPATILENETFLQVTATLGFPAITARTFVRVLLVSVIAVFVLKNVYLVLLAYLQARFTSRAESETSVKLISDYLNRPYEFYLNADLSTILRTFNSDIPHVYILLQEVMLLITEIAVSICLCILLFVVDFKMTLAISALMLVMVLIIVLVMKPVIGRLGQERVEMQGKTMKWMQEGLTGIKDVKVAFKEDFFVRQYARSYTVLATAGRRYTVLNAMPRMIIETVCIAGLLGYMLLVDMNGGSLMQMLPQLTAFGLAAVRLMPSVNRISSHLSAIAYYEPSLNAVCENVDMKVVKSYNPRKAGEKLKIQKDICLKGISYHYPNTEKLIFHNADFPVPVGSSVGVIGTSGAGKTTIVDILLGLLKPQKGTLLADGKAVDPDSPEWLANIGYIAQNIYMLDGTIRENVAFGMDPGQEDERRIWEVLREAQLEDFVKGLPQGLDTGIGERGIRVSGGQRQRIGIARALYHDPEILVFDEATSALDNETEAAIMDAINSLKGRKTMIIIAHRLKTIENCDIVYKVDEGRILRQEE